MDNNNNNATEFHIKSLEEFSEKVEQTFKKFEEEKAYSEDIIRSLREFCDTKCLLRYLRARNWSVEKAEKMLKETLSWRAEYKPHLITALDVQASLPLESMYHFGFDKFQRPIIYVLPGKTNPNDAEQRIKFLVYTVENTILQMKTNDVQIGVQTQTTISDSGGENNVGNNSENNNSGDNSDRDAGGIGSSSSSMNNNNKENKLNNNNNIIQDLTLTPSQEQITLVMDFSEYGSRGKSPDSIYVAKTSVFILSNHYPERLGHCFVLNSPWYFSMIYSLVKPLLNSVTTNKMQWVSGKNDIIYNALDEFISNESKIERYLLKK